MNQNTLIIITGPTGSGKTSLALDLAEYLKCEIISADSRQLYKDIPIGTAAPTADDLARIKHHFVGTLALDKYYSAAQFESDVIDLLPTLFKSNKYVVMCGGSMMYVDAVAHGIDEIPTISNETRTKAYELYENGGIDTIRSELHRLDPEYYTIVDKNNPKRIIHAIEIIMESGCKYSELRTGQTKIRPFRILKFAIEFPRDILFERINSRVDKMIEQGIIAEALHAYPFRHLNSLNTVGYKELFAYFDGKMDYETALSRIAKNTRVYAKKQMTWLKKDNEIIWLNPQENMLQHIIDHI